ncbi:MAG: hypothetical protein ACLS7Z_02560 [Christensenellales bacterium]
MNGETVRRRTRLPGHSASGGEAVTFTVKRDGQTLDLTITRFTTRRWTLSRGFSFGRRTSPAVWRASVLGQYNIESVKRFWTRSRTWCSGGRAWTI